MKMTYVAVLSSKTFTRSSATRVYESAVIGRAPTFSPFFQDVGDWSWHTTRAYAEKAAQTLRKCHGANPEGGAQCTQEVVRCRRCRGVPVQQPRSEGRSQGIRLDQLEVAPTPDQGGGLRAGLQTW